MDTTGNTVLITGAGTGIGPEAAPLEDARTFACDISDAGQAGRLLDYPRGEHPGINVALLDAGVTNTYKLFGDEDMFGYASEEMAVNYLSAVRLAQLFEPLLRDEPSAATIVTTSGVAPVPDVQNPTYSATEAALHSLVLAERFVLQKAGSDIKVFEVMAPPVDTPFSKDVHSDAKVPPGEVADALLADLEHDVLEMHVGITADMYQTYLESPEQALRAVNATLGG